MIFLLQGCILRFQRCILTFHVKLPGCNQSEIPFRTDHLAMKCWLSGKSLRDCHNSKSINHILSILSFGWNDLMHSPSKTWHRAFNKNWSTQMLNVWYIYLHVPPKLPKCRQIGHTLSIWGHEFLTFSKVLTNSLFCVCSFVFRSNEGVFLAGFQPGGATNPALRLIGHRGTLHSHWDHGTNGIFCIFTYI